MTIKQVYLKLIYLTRLFFCFLQRSISVIFVVCWGHFHLRMSKCFTCFTGRQVMARIHTMIDSSGNGAWSSLAFRLRNRTKAISCYFCARLSFHLYRSGKPISIYCNWGLREIDTACFWLFAEVKEIFSSECSFLTASLQATSLLYGVISWTPQNKIITGILSIFAWSGSSACLYQTHLFANLFLWVSTKLALGKAALSSAEFKLNECC